MESDLSQEIPEAAESEDEQSVDAQEGFFAENDFSVDEKEIPTTDKELTDSDDLEHMELAQSSEGCVINEEGKLTSYTGYGGSVEIPAGTKIIGKNAFKNKETITSITIPASVTAIESSAFYGCKNLVTVTIEKKMV